MRSLPPLNWQLVKLEDTHQNFSTVDGKYDTRTKGIVMKTEAGGFSDKYDGKDIANLFGKRVYFEEYKEGARIKRDGAMYCFIKIDDIRGYEDAQ